MGGGGGGPSCCVARKKPCSCLEFARENGH